VGSISIETVLKEESEQVERSRRLRFEENPTRPAASESLVGLAFSGGGIRSATFGLGVLQALAKARMLRAFDYMSTVSGGGYIGSWLMAWMHHQNIGVKKIEEYLSDQSPAPRLERPEVRFLRSYSNYLTPRKGILGADFWAFAATYLRNTVLNQIILVLMLLALLLVPHCLMAVLHFLKMGAAAASGQPSFLKDFNPAQYLGLTVGLFVGLVGVFVMGLNLCEICPEKKKRYLWYTRLKWIQILIIVPMFLSACFVSYGIGPLFRDCGVLEHPFTELPLLGMVLYGGPWAAALLVRTFFVRTKANLISSGWVLLTAAVTGALVSYLFYPLSRILLTTTPGATADLIVASNRQVLTFGTPAFVLIMLMAGVLHVGLLGRELTDGEREWWARLGAWLGLYAFAWVFVFLIAIYFPSEFWRTWNKGGAHFTWPAILTWGTSTLYGVLFGRSAKTHDVLPDARFKDKILGYLAKVVPYIFILGFLLILSLLAAKISFTLHTMNGPTTREWWRQGSYPSSLILVCLFTAIAAIELSIRVDVNEFSIHYLYRNRLVRCYLGASVVDRQEQPFTGFSEEDDVPLADLQIPLQPREGVDDRPLPILNTSLNVVHGKELALQTRKARAFCITPLYCGYTRPSDGKAATESAYGLTSAVGADRPDSKRGARLGTAMAVSGAAASPNMGSYSAPALAFLMTLFDVRLGWWQANPKGPEKNWRKASPYFGFYWLLRELFGFTSEEGDYVYLSDGGHFENLAIYELVRRRCKLIVACDASCDSAYGFSDLHNAMEKCRTDFGIEIEMTADEIGKIRPTGQPPRASAHYAVGKIRYCPNHPENDGMLIYLKPALVAADAADVLGYSNRNSAFPNDTTANQWFDESHFENYRAMGESTGRAAMDHIHDELVRLLGTVK